MSIERHCFLNKSVIMSFNQERYFDAWESAIAKRPDASAVLAKGRLVCPPLKQCGRALEVDECHLPRIDPSAMSLLPMTVKSRFRVPRRFSHSDNESDELEKMIYIHMFFCLNECIRFNNVTIRIMLNAEYFCTWLFLVVG